MTSGWVRLLLKLLPTFADVPREKFRSCASFKKILASNTSEEGLSLITADYDENIIQAIFLLRNRFIRYRMPQHEQNNCSVLLKGHQSTIVFRA